MTVSHLKLVITYEWAGLETECLPQADRVMEALLATDDQATVHMDVTVTSGRVGRGPRAPRERPAAVILE